MNLLLCGRRQLGMLGVSHVYFRLLGPICLRVGARLSVWRMPLSLDMQLGKNNST
jgi:hypothetical protein